LLGGDAIATGHPDMFHRGTIDGYIEMIRGKVESKKVSASEFNVGVLPGERLLLEIICQDMKTFLRRHEAHVTVLATELQRLSRSVWHFLT
jgi:hypothetical protein